MAHTGSKRTYQSPVRIAKKTNTVFRLDPESTPVLFNTVFDLVAVKANTLTFSL